MNITTLRNSEMRRTQHDSRNKTFRKINNVTHMRAVSTKRGSLYSSSTSINENNEESKSKSRKKKTNLKTALLNYNVLKTTKDLGYKDMNQLKSNMKNNHQSSTKIKNKFLFGNNDYNISSRNRNTNNGIIIKEISMIKTNNFNNTNDPSVKMGFLDMINSKKKKQIKGIKIQNFSKVFNVFSKVGNAKTHRNHVINLK